MQSAAPAMTSFAATPRPTIALDNPALFDALFAQAHASYSSVGRAMDVDQAMKFSRRRSGRRRASNRSSSNNNTKNMSNNTHSCINDKASHTDRDSRSANDERKDVVSEVLMSGSAFINRRERQRRMQQQRAQQQAWQVTDEKALHIPHLPRMAPTFTQTVHAGTTALGGIQLDGREFRTVIGLVPTRETIASVTDHDELISSFRPCTYDAARTAREEELRQNADPHPDYLHHLETIFDTNTTHRLLDEPTLPSSVRSAATAALIRSQREHHTANNELIHRSNSKNNTHDAKSDKANAEEHKQKVMPHTVRPQRRSALRNYHPRYTQVKARLRGGYVEPLAAPRVVRSIHNADAIGNKDDCNNDDGVPVENTSSSPTTDMLSHLPHSLNSLADRDDTASNISSRAGLGTPCTDALLWKREAGRVSAVSSACSMATMADTICMHRDDERTHNTRESLAHPQQSKQSKQPRMRGRNSPSANKSTDGKLNTATATTDSVNGSSMFVSRVARGVVAQSAAPDVCYWPYPDIRSTHPRPRTSNVVFAHPVNTRRRELAMGAQGSTGGVPPVGSYNVSHATQVLSNYASDAAHSAGPAWSTQTSRESHWIARRAAVAAAESNGSGAETLSATEAGAAAQRAVWPHVRVVKLPPRASGDDNNNNNRCRNSNAANTVSIECDLNFPPSTIGHPAALTHVRAFSKMSGRDDAADRIGLHSTYTGAAADEVNTLRAVGDEAAKAACGGVLHNNSSTHPHPIRYGLVDKRARAATIHPHASGHDSQNDHVSAGEIHDVPNLKWVKPNTTRAATLRSSSLAHTTEQVAMHDLSYDLTPGYNLLQPRITGDPMMSSHISRTQRQRASRNAAATSAATLNANKNKYSNVTTAIRGGGGGSIRVNDHVSSVAALQRGAASGYVPGEEGGLGTGGGEHGSDSNSSGAVKQKQEGCDFAKQVTKETQFTGHAVASERWARNHPRAPGPGKYDVRYSQLEKHTYTPQIG